MRTSTRKPKFLYEVNLLVKLGRLKRVVSGEAHMGIDPALQTRISALSIYSTQIVLMTGTLPLSKEQPFVDAYLLKVPIFSFSMPIIRTTIKYSVPWMKHDLLEAYNSVRLTASKCRKVLPQILARVIIVLCTSRSLTTKFGKLCSELLRKESLRF